MYGAKDFLQQTMYIKIKQKMENEFTESQLINLKNNIKDFYYKNKLLFFSILLYAVIALAVSKR